MKTLEERYLELDAIREHGVFTHDEMEEWIEISTIILDELLYQNSDKFGRMKND